MRHRPDRPCLPGRQADPTQAGVQRDQLQYMKTPLLNLRAYEAPAYTPAEAEAREFQRGLGDAETSLKILKPSAFQNMAHVGSFNQSSILNPQFLENTAESKRYLYLLLLYFAKIAIEKPLHLPRQGQ